MKKILVIVAIVIALIAGSAYRSLSQLVHSADAFMDAVRSKNIPAARALSTDGFNKDLSDDAFARLRNDMGLDNAKAVNWGDRKFYNGDGSIEGVVVDNVGHSKSIRLKLSKENGEWHVRHVDVAK